jgi:cobalt-zinc-cadmium resistance protein CzcA
MPLQGIIPVSGGNYLEHNREQYIIRGFGQITTKNDILNIVVTKLDNKPVFIKDLAEVETGTQISREV